MKIIDCEQGSEEWFQARLGRVTASRFGDVLAKGQGKTRKAYMIELAAEILTGENQDKFSNEWMEWGTAQEPEARKKYEKVTGASVVQVGFFADGDVGCSPDGLVGDKGLVEIKCPKTSTHITNILENRMLPKYNPQVQGQMWLADREWCDFVSYDPRVAQYDLDFWSVRVERDDGYIQSLAENVRIFCEQLHELVDKLKGGNNG
jgi:putative phage-type endonuclease